MKYKLVGTRTIISIGLILISYSIQPLYAQFIKEKKIIPGNSINPLGACLTDKKLIQSTNSLQWNFVEENISAMETSHPEIDGIALSMNGNFMRDYLILQGNKQWTDEDIQLSTVSRIKWNRFKDNFVILCLTDSVGLDLFNDEKWSIIMHNTRMVSKMVNAGHLKGVFLDNENYFEKLGSFPWKFNPESYPNRTEEEVKAKCRERGKAFIQALQTNVSYPLVIMNFFWFGDYWNNYDSKTGRQFLYMSFMDGMVEASDKYTTFVEGNELAYYFTDTEMFTDIVNEYKHVRFTKYGAEELNKNYKTKLQVGHGIYPSLYYGRFKRWPHIYTDEENSKWWEHQLYHSLLTTDKYVWIWSEKWNWWNDGAATQELPIDFISIIWAAKEKLKNQEGLDFDMIDSRPMWKENLVKPSEKWKFGEMPKIIIKNARNNISENGDIIIKTKAFGETNKVEFYVNSIRVGIDSTKPYSTKVFGLKSGKYTIFARVFNSQNEHTTSSPKVVTIKNKSNSLCD